LFVDLGDKQFGPGAVVVKCGEKLFATGLPVAFFVSHQTIECGLVYLRAFWSYLKAEKEFLGIPVLKLE